MLIVFYTCMIMWYCTNRLDFALRTYLQDSKCQGITLLVVLLKNRFSFKNDVVVIRFFEAYNHGDNVLTGYKTAGLGQTFTLQIVHLNIWV